MKITRLFTVPNLTVEDQIKWKKVSASIPGANFNMTEVEVPEHWSETATNILAQKYFRKAGVPDFVETVDEADVPFWLRRQKPAVNATLVGETSAKQVFHRLAGHWTYVGWKNNYFRKYIDIPKGTYNIIDTDCVGYMNDEEAAHAFYDEIYYMLAMQIAAPNSPQWFNTGLWWAYGIEGPESGQWAIDAIGKVFQTKNSYERPQVHACYIQPITDDLVNPGGIMDLATREVRLFKYGSGTGSNFSNIRGKGEKLSGGGVSSGLMSFLEILDRAAGAIQSGGTTRRAAKMVILDADHPEIEDFIDWKVREDNKAAAMYVGSVMIREREGSILIPDTIEDRRNAGFSFEEFGIGWEGEAIRTVSGQNSNNSIRVSDKFMEGVCAGHGSWNLRERTTGKICKTLDINDFWNKICRAAWASADPGIQFHDTINKWHTCKADGEIRASNPCSEYMHLDNTACNLASINLVKALLRDGQDIYDIYDNLDTFAHITRLWTIVLDISVTMASYPSREIAESSIQYRTLGLGYANLGGLLMRLGVPYDSHNGRYIAAGITAYMHGVALVTSKELARDLGPFLRYNENKKSMLDVMHLHQNQALTISGKFADVWKYYSKLSYEDGIGFRNAQVTLLAPTGTISLVMDCDTSGIEPLYALSTEKNLSGGGKIYNFPEELIVSSLVSLGYKKHEINLIVAHIKSTGRIYDAPTFHTEHQPVFQCAVGDAPLPPISHVQMVAAVQPFLSGAVSKTVNLPHHATIDDISKIYIQAHCLGLKSIAVYRDGSKLSQPLVQKKEEKEESHFMDVAYIKEKAIEETATVVANQIIEEWTRGVKTDRISRGGREELLPRRKGYTQKYKIDGQTLYLRTGEYEDGRLGEIFVNMSKEGSTARAIMEAWAKAVSIGLQFGVPLSEYIEAFHNVKFDPSGIVQGHDRIKMCSSPVDLIARDLGVSYLGRDDLAQVPVESKPEAIEAALEIKKIVESVKSTVSGEFCRDCGGSLSISGTCKTCILCGSTTGCG